MYLVKFIYIIQVYFKSEMNFFEYDSNKIFQNNLNVIKILILIVYSVAIINYLNLKYILQFYVRNESEELCWIILLITVI